MTIDIEEIETIATTNKNDEEERVKALIQLKKNECEKLYTHTNEDNELDKPAFEIYSVDVDDEVITVSVSRVSKRDLHSEYSSISFPQGDLDDHIEERVYQTNMPHLGVYQLLFNQSEKYDIERRILKKLMRQRNPELQDLETYLTAYEI